MQSECTAGQLEFEGLGKRRVLAAFDAGRTTSDGGVLLLREVAERTGMAKPIAWRTRTSSNGLTALHRAT